MESEVYKRFMSLLESNMDGPFLFKDEEQFKNSCSLFWRLEVLNEVEDQFKEFLDWVMDDDRKPANTKFTSGAKRNLGREIEFRIKNISQSKGGV